MGLTWEEVEASAQDRNLWRQRLALCFGDAGWIKGSMLVIWTRETLSHTSYFCAHALYIVQPRDIMTKRFLSSYILKLHVVNVTYSIVWILKCGCHFLSGFGIFWSDAILLSGRRGESVNEMHSCCKHSNHSRCHGNTCREVSSWLAHAHTSSVCLIWSSREWRYYCYFCGWQDSLLKSVENCVVFYGTLDICKILRLVSHIMDNWTWIF